jgi:hypothetical protein
MPLADAPRPCPLTVEVHEGPAAPPGDLIGALAELLLARARSRVQAATALPRTPRLDAEESPAPRSPARRQRRDERATRKLDEIGIYHNGAGAASHRRLGHRLKEELSCPFFSNL